jgi:hypothetical protein
VSDAYGLTHWYVWSYAGWQALKVTVGELTSLSEQRKKSLDVSQFVPDWFIRVPCG